MDRVFESGASATPPSPPVSPSSGYASAGNPGSAIPATKPGPYWYHMMTESLRRLIEDAGLTPDHTDLTLVSQAVAAMIAGTALAAKHNVGDIFDFAGPTPPPGALALPTSPTTISRTTYAALFAVIGTTWGAGDGSSTFGMPYCPADHVLVQANGNVGTATLGEVKAHSHVFNLAAGETADGSNINGTNQGNSYTNSTNSTGGAANLAAGVRVLKCVQYLG